MTLKFAHLVAIQLGIFVGVAACLLFLRVESPKPRTATEIHELAAELAAAVKAAPEAENERAEPDTAELVPGQLAPALPNEYSPEAVEQYRALATKLYYEQIAPRRNPTSTLSHSSSAAVAPVYTQVAQQPAVVAAYEPEPEPEPVAYVDPAPVIAYAQPAQFIAFSHGRRFANRCRPAPHRGEHASNQHRRRDRRGNHFGGGSPFHLNRSLGIVHRQNSGVSFCPPTQGIRPRGKR